MQKTPKEKKIKDLNRRNATRENGGEDRKVPASFEKAGAYGVKRSGLGHCSPDSGNQTVMSVRRTERTKRSSRMASKK